MYKTTLVGIQPVGGVITPRFQPDLFEYAIETTHGSDEVLHVALMLDFSSYEPMTCPRITMDGEDVPYTPLDGLSVEIQLGQHVGPVEKDVHIKVADPKGKQGLLSFMLSENAHEYVLHVSKPPRLNYLISAQNIVVKDETTGEEVVAKMPFDPKAPAGTYSYTVGAETKSFTIKVECPQEDGVVQMYDGSLAPVGSAKTVDFSGTYESTTHGTCEYSNPKWSSQPVQRTYVLQVGKHLKALTQSISAQLMALPEFGVCDPVDKNNADIKAHHYSVSQSFGELVATSAFVCRADRAQSMFVATFSSADGAQPKASLANTETGREIGMPNAMPEEVGMTQDRQYYTLRIDAGDLTIVYPVVILWPGRCNTLTCPSDQAVKREDPFSAKVHMCLQEKCSDQDADHCCGDRAFCSSYSQGCPAGKSVREHADSVLCSGVVCTQEADVETCCSMATSTTTTSTATVTTTTVSTTTVTTTTATTTSATHSTSTRTLTASSSSKTKTTSTSSTKTQTSSATSTETGTGTTSTTTVSSSTTTSTTLFCIEPNAVWLPLDMPGSKPDIVEDSLACKERCKQTYGCTTFGFWTNGRHCHLQNDNATQQLYGFGFESGPAECSPKHTVTQTTTNPIPANMRCIQDGILWSPLLGLAMYIEGKQEEASSKCQQFCAETNSCARFQMDTATHTCSLAGADADPLTGFPGVLSGPPVCDDIYGELADEIMPSNGFWAAADDASNFSPDAAYIADIAGADTPVIDLNCVQEGLLWTPEMSVPEPMKKGTREESIAACQSACYAMDDCHHFVASFLDNMCRFASYDALALDAAGIGIVSGPPACEGSFAYGELAVLQRYSAGAAGSKGALRQRRSIEGAWIAKGAALFGCSFFVAAAALAVRRQPSNEPGQALMLGEVDEEAVE